MQKLVGRGNKKSISVTHSVAVGVVGVEGTRCSAVLRWTDAVPHGLTSRSGEKSRRWWEDDGDELQQRTEVGQLKGCPPPSLDSGPASATNCPITLPSASLKTALRSSDWPCLCDDMLARAEAAGAAGPTDCSANSHSRAPHAS